MQQYFLEEEMKAIDEVDFLLNQFEGRNPTKITPQEKAYYLKITLNTPLSHHDPGQQDKSNKSLFRRQTKILKTKKQTKLITQDKLDKILANVQVPIEIADILQQATLSQFLASAILKLFISMYGGKDGAGLFSGVGRYKFLEERFNHAAVMCNSLLDVWGLASKTLQVPPSTGKYQNDLLNLLMIPSSLGVAVINELSQNPRVCSVLARAWSENEKMSSPEYVKAINKKQNIQTSFTDDGGGNIMEIDADDQMVIESTRGEFAILNYSVEDLIKTNNDDIIVQIPCFSANSLRHEIIREPIMWHLFNKLNIAFDEPAMATTAMFYNGGDIAAGSSAPSDKFWCSNIIRKTYPSLALISGATDSFILGEGNLKVHSWIVCKEENDVTTKYGVSSELSIFEMLDDYHLTRHANRVDSGQMPYSFEGLIPNVEILVRLSLSPYADELHIGALMSAIKTYLESDSTLGGQSRAGFGLVSCAWVNGSEFDQDAFELYEDYLETNREDLRQGIVDGSLGTGKAIIKTPGYFEKKGKKVQK